MSGRRPLVGFAQNHSDALPLALACKLSGERPKNVLEWPDMERLLAAGLEARIRNEEADAIKGRHR